MKSIPFGALLVPSLALVAGTVGAQQAARAELRSAPLNANAITAAATAENPIEIRVPGKPSIAHVWSEGGVPHYSLSLDGQSFSAAKATHYDLLLRAERFDPARTLPTVSETLRATSDNKLMIVQYWTQGIEDYREVIRSMGAEIHFFLANHSNVVSMSGATARQVRGLEFVRSVTPYHPHFKLEESLLEGIEARTAGSVKLDLLTTRRHGHAPVIEWVEANGGKVEHVSKETYFMTVTLDWSKLPSLAALNSVKWIDPYSVPEVDMNNARQLFGANYAQAQGDYDGTGVRGEVLDTGVELTHPDFAGRTMAHGANNIGASHGTCCAGIVFGDGSGNANATGAMPNGFLIGAYYNNMVGSRYNHSSELVDPSKPFKAVFQTNSWGGSRTLQYNSSSSEIDQILFDFDHLSICQSQSNANNQQSRPQAWAKNIIAVGALNHFDTVTPTDDLWGGASIGPAADGRVKPDLAAFYDRILTTDRVGGVGYSGGNYFTNFGGTSGATPIVAGHLGLFYQMWHDGLFGNPTAGSVFESAPNNTTAKAFLINTSGQWRFEGVNHRNGRFKQGWGRPHMGNLIDFSGLLNYIDESVALTNLQTHTVNHTVQSGDRALKVTMIYRDPPGTTSSSLHRINNVDLKVTSPSNVVYWGNHFLDRQPWTLLPGGSPNEVDTVENVWIRLPEPGTWTIEVIASEVNEDTHSETGAVDVDFALVWFSGSPIIG